MPKELSDRERFALWNTLHEAEIAALNYSTADAMPFAAQISLMALGTVAVGETTGTFKGVERTKQNIIADRGIGNSLFVNTGSGQLRGNHLDREFMVDPGAAVLISNTEPVRLRGNGATSWLCLVVPNGLPNDSFGNVQGALAQPIAADAEALSLLRRYYRFLDADAPLVSPNLMLHAAETIVDLIAMAAGLKGEDITMSGAKGLRAARLAAIDARIRQRFVDPTLSAKTLAQELNLSPRYVYDLLQKTGVGLSERLLELRLLKSRATLADPDYRNMRISEIALTCGFSDISHFNRCFRRRFGCTPTAAR